MRTISVSVSESDYEAFKTEAKRQERPAAELIREAMAYYRAEKLEGRTRLESIPVLAGHRPVSELPGRDEIWSEIFDARDEG